MIEFTGSAVCIVPNDPYCIRYVPIPIYVNLVLILKRRNNNYVITNDPSIIRYDVQIPGWANFPDSYFLRPSDTSIF